MDIRKIQRTGDMHYLYMPTNWCKKHKVSSKSRVYIKENNDGSLVISPTQKDIEPKHLKLKIDEEDQDIINKLIVACYINPLTSFKIDLSKEITAKKLLNQKTIVSLESVEIEKKTISCDSSVMTTDPGQLLKTMVTKIKNLAIVMVQNYNEDLINRYEEEIDRSKLLIQKSIIHYMTHSVPVDLRMIDLYYISQITTDLERAVDHVIRLTRKDESFLSILTKNIELLKKIMDSDKLSLMDAIDFAKKVKAMQHKENEYEKRRIKELLSNIAEIVLDWSITNEISK